jgi:hypothetical protein
LPPLRQLLLSTRKRLTDRAPRGYGSLYGWETAMLIAPLFAAALFVAVAADPLHDATGDTNLSMQEKLAATEPLVSSATQCIVHAVATSSQYRSTAQIGDLIVDSMPACLTPVRAMIDAYDRYYGDGAGEAFFMGPYLDVLPKAVAAGANNASP